MSYLVLWNVLLIVFEIWDYCGTFVMYFALVFRGASYTFNAIQYMFIPLVSGTEIIQRLDL